MSSGIPSALIGKIFEPFFTTKGLGGSGLGLAISREIILNHQGEIRVESEPGRGARFIVSLPRTKMLVMQPQAVTLLTAKGGVHVNGDA